MYKKICDRCMRPSYSSSEYGVWLCPTCNKDISYIKKQEAEKHIVNPFIKAKAKRTVSFT
ncbi:hypothetical protein [Bacillus suaedaesalsae]|uniref:Uncharacterized protein n=1 Tax=Bacillus suaedaesalsae TaxID=2810349 RepID=A0ABS2DKM9_9BACI|nr:hypothetical protein [Bacillus suaedaesalsae]MBM6619055.1 hypothetical protein [Bacillus suaedaesalsae]